ncbi:MAG: nuclear transport factor 2 family protein [Bacteroidota bacterium]
MKTVITLMMALATLIVSAQQEQEEAIKQTIQQAYVDGIQNRGSIEEIKAGFDPGFNLLGVDQNNELTKLPISRWIEMVKKAKAKGQAPKPAITAEYPMVDITGNAAIAKVELYKGNNMLFTDYLSLYKFDDGWRIVSKIYQRH